MTADEINLGPQEILETDDEEEQKRIVAGATIIITAIENAANGIHSEGYSADETLAAMRIAAITLHRFLTDRGVTA